MTSSDTRRVDVFYATNLLKIIDGIHDCLLRVALSSKPNNDLPMLKMPGHPKALLGIVVHNLMDEISQGHHIETNMANLFDESIAARIEADVQNGVAWGAIDTQSWDFKRFRKRAITRLERCGSEVDATRFHVVERTGRPDRAERLRPRLGREVTVKANDETIVGRIDEVYFDGDNLVISDDKTGKTSGHRTQLMLYAAMYHDDFDQWPAIAQIRDLSGQVVERFEIDRRECQHILDQAIEICASVNILAEGDEQDFSLAENKVGVENCGFCHHRPGCLPHRKRFLADSSLNPGCISGRVVRIDEAADGQLVITIVNGEEKHQIVNINPRWIVDEGVEPADWNPVVTAFGIYRNEWNPGVIYPVRNSHRIIIEHR